MSNAVEMGLIDIYLDDNCQCHQFKICAYKDSLPNNFIWDGNSPLQKTGGWVVNDKEYTYILKDIVTRPKYLKTFLFQSGLYSIKLFFNYDMEEIAPAAERVKRAVATNYDEEYTVFLESRENTNHLKVDFMNFTQDVIVAICLVLYFFSFLNKKVDRRTRMVMVFFLIALIVNAWICSTFSGVFPRYQTRVIWLLPLPLFLYLGKVGCFSDFYSFLLPSIYNLKPKSWK
nr:hypothetical protein [Mucilaginibacter oryzae]